MICFTFNFYWWKGTLHFHFLLVKKVCFTFTFYRWKMAHTITFTFTNGEIWSASLSLSMGEIWSRQLLLFSPEVKYELTAALSMVSTVPCRRYDVRAFWQCTAVPVPIFIVKALCIPVLTACSDRWFVGKGWSWKSESSNVVLWTCDGQKRS